LHRRRHIAAADGAGHPVEREQRGGHDLHRVVVQVGRDPRPLLVLGAQHRRQHLLAPLLRLAQRGLRGIALGHVAGHQQAAGDLAGRVPGGAQLELHVDASQ
jgi:hypothetical protein